MLPTADQALWVAIRNRTRAIAFSGSGYKDFIDRVLCRRAALPGGRTDKVLTRQLEELRSDIYGTAAYDLLKTATEIFLLLNCGVKIEGKDLATGESLFDKREEAIDLGETVSLDEISERLRAYLGDGRLPYINRVLRDAFSDQTIIDRVHCEGVLSSRIESPCLLELIWSYWHEEGDAGADHERDRLRFQNNARRGGRDPLATFEIDPLRPLNNMLWGYIQDEQHRLTVARRAYEYDHHYGLTLHGKAVPELRAGGQPVEVPRGVPQPAASLHRLFYKEDDDTTVIADGFPVLNALKEVHLLLAEGRAQPVRRPALDGARRRC